MKILKLILIVSFGIYSIISEIEIQAQTTIGPFSYYPTNQGGTILGQAKIDGVPASSVDIIAAFDPSGECVGASAFVINGGISH